MGALRAGRLDAPAVLAQLHAAAHRVGAARLLLVAARRASRRCAGAAGSAPLIAISAGRTSSRKVTIAETGFPGRPKTSVSPWVPNQVGLPGFSATPQKRSSTPSSASAPLTWSCSPTETPPLINDRVGAERRARSPPALPRDRRRRARRRRPRRPPARPERGERVGVGVANAAGPHLLARLEQLVAADEDAHPRAAVAARPTRVRARRSRPSSAGPIRVPGRQHHLARPRCPRRRGARHARARPRPRPGRGRPRARCPRHGPQRRRRPEPPPRSRSAPPRRRRQRARSGAPRATPRLSRRATGEPGAAPRVSPARTAKPSIAEPSKPGTGSLRPRGPRRAPCRAPRAATTARRRARRPPAVPRRAPARARSAAAGPSPHPLASSLAAPLAERVRRRRRKRPTKVASQAARASPRKTCGSGSRNSSFSASAIR